MTKSIPILVLAASAAGLAQAFDSAAWLTKTEVFAREAERLRAERARVQKMVEEPAENVSVTLERHPDGSVKTALTAKEAQFFLDLGFVWGKGVVVSEYNPDGTRRGFIAAQDCLVDRETKSGWVEGRVHAVYDKTTLDGEQVYFSFDEEYARIFKEAQITSSGLKLKEVKL